MYASPTAETRSSTTARPQPAFGGRALPFFQPKLTVNAPDDAYEQEADRVADQVMRMPAYNKSSAGKRKGDAPIAQQMSLTPVAGVQRKCAECEQEDQAQRKETGSASGGFQAPSIVGQVISGGGGRSMDGGTRQFMESRFGQDFGQVRIHTGSQAAESAEAIGARAYTSGDNIVFGQGEYQPGNDGGKRLLAHELAHVGQQGRSGQKIQRHEREKSGFCSLSPEFFKRAEVLFKKMEIITPIAKAIAKDYLNRPGRPDPLLKGLLRPAVELENDPRKNIAPAVTTSVYQKPIFVEADPNEAFIVEALRKKIDLVKIGKGTSPEDWAWKWVDEPTIAKTGAEKSGEIGQWVGEQYIGYKSSGLGLCLMSGKALYQQQMPSTKDMILTGADISLKVGANWAKKESLLVAASFLTGAGQVLTVATLVISAVELLLSLSEPAEKKLSPYAQAQAGIVAKVRDYLALKAMQKAAHDKFSKPFEMEPMKKDKTSLGPKFFPGIGWVE